MKSISIAAALVVALAVALLVLRALYTLRTVDTFKIAWQIESQLKIADDSVVIAAIGDSTVQGIGAVRKEEGFVGQVASRVEAQTNSGVQIFNFSVSGAEASEVLQTQVDQVKKLSRFDIVILAVGPNDIAHKVELKEFMKNYEAILKQLPGKKVVIASLPPIKYKDSKARSSYEWNKALVPLAQKYDVTVAPVYDNVKPRENDFRIYSGDFYHPSKTGYGLWADAFTPKVLDILKK